ncbi:mucin-2-like [Pristis pectinata]|uniref:mucin-2-like n=1 Tax=Pristis pectinata TaxID=685728 RepID=UPI00223C9A10|nr:mucin-2-like [Pristis pectinata]
MTIVSNTMREFALVVFWALSFCRGLERESSKPFIRSLEETSTARGRGFCSTWGNGAFRTFDNTFYHFTSTCNYVLSRQCKGGTEDFNIQIRRGSDGNLDHVFIQIEGVKVLIVNGTISVQDVLVSLPHNNKVISIHKHGVNTRLSNRKHTISVNWNGNDALWVNLDDNYQGQLCGLCGEFDKNSSVYDSTFFDANKLDVLGHTCYSSPPSESPCNASSKCQPITSLFLSYPENYLINYLKMCQADVCSCKQPRSECASFEEVARQCSKGKDEKWKTWRKETSCTQPTCPRNQIYKECGSAYIPTCTDPNPQQQCDQCVSTCVCPEGHLLDNIRGTNRCINKNECPCEYSGQFYQSGDIRNTTCQSCICKSGSWSCSYRSCPGTCAIEEATYFTTFDNSYYSITGDCSYYAVVTDNWTIKVEIHQCQAAFKQTCLQRVTLTTNQTTYVFSNDGKVYSSGQAIGIPMKTGEIIIFQQSSMYIQVATAFGLKMQVQTAPLMQLYISLPVNAKGTTRGLCGTFNGKAEDDFLSEQGIVESTPITFADSWKTEDCCLELTIPSPCVSSENENYAKLHCSQLKDPASAFSICHSTVDYLKYYQMCMAATCACENINDCLCGALGTYVHECAANGIIVRNWRRDICSKPCTNTQVFENDMRACNRTCRSLAEYDYTCEVKDVPVFGCGCPEGKYMDGTGACLDKSDCPCYIGELVVNKGQSMIVNGRNCKCENGKLHCPIARTTTSRECLNGKLYNDCSKMLVNKQSIQRSCRTLNIPLANSPCIPGCVCPADLVEDDNGRCIRPEQCPCLFGGEKYPAGKIIQKDCNQCTCKTGVWNCTTNRCPKTCQVYGDGQYITFDGRRYMFDGNCEYIFVEDHCNQGEGIFQILTESVPCCENGVTCSRNIKILFAEVEFLLKDERVIRTDKSRQAQCQDHSYSFHTVGLYLILSFSNGITVIWDRHTRVSITLDPRWKNKVCGLCGNFNDDVADDLTTKGNSLVTNTAQFGNSWKSSLSCSDTLNQTFPCDRNPYCLAWAQRRCGIMKDEMFQKCHKRVNPIPYYDACVQEACACDMEGKYLGFCTAVAVYAEACNKAGVCIQWRTPDLCPVYCDYYNSPSECSWHYQPCGTIRTQTCSDHFIGKKYSAVLEGCYARCPENAPYLDENKMKCVNLTDCTCYYNGKILQPGSRTRNACEECECKNGKVTCREITPTEIPTTSVTSYTPETTESMEVTAATSSTTSYISETTSPTEIQTATTSTTSYIPETTSTTEVLTTTTSTSSYAAETTPLTEILTTTSSTTSYVAEVISTTVVVPTTISSASFSTKERCNGVWSSWFNDHTPSLDSPGDAELLDPRRDDLCPSSSFTITEIQCQVFDYPEHPRNELTENVTCDKNIGLICRVTQRKSKEVKLCSDYQIRVCCELQTTTLNTSSTTTISETTSPTEILTATTSTSSYTTETTATTEILAKTTSITNYVPETTTEIPTETTSTTSNTLGRYTTVITTGKQAISTTTNELLCNGEWSRWFNRNTPSIQNKGDSELLEELPQRLCPFFPYKISNIDCEAVKFPQQPISETKDIVTCDIKKGLICNYTEQSPKNHFMCLDYRIRVCCEPTQSTSTTAASTVIPPVSESKIVPTINEPKISHVTVVPPESCWCTSDPPRKCLESWKENCTTITCIKGDVFKIDPIVCPELVKPICHNDIEPVKVHTENGCCEQWECDCECEVWGDPHFKTFGGLLYNFFDNCTYTLVEEKVPKYNFSVLVDNYFCLPLIKKSCPKGLIIFYNGNVVHISNGDGYMLTVNGNNVRLPYNSEGFHITKLGWSTHISIPDIRTEIIAFQNAFRIRVPEKYFINNTQGQCGSCSSDQCVRKNGKVESSDCCHKTAFDWKVDDPNKPYCRSAPTNVPCTSASPTPACQSESAICDIIQEEPFEKCRRKIDLDKFVKTCLFDHCALNSTIDCSSLEAAALACASVGVCVDWRSSANGMCNYTCDQGLVYKPCATKNDDQCENKEVKVGEKFSTAEEGCFCPDGLILSEDNSKCVPFCEVCHDYLGQPRKDGDLWEDPKDPCISYSCTQFGVFIRNRSCIQDETCPESHRTYIDRCCFTCNEQDLCSISSFNETIISGTCKATFVAHQCQGHCSSATRYDVKRNSMVPSCRCCKEDLTEKREVKLYCENGKTKSINYVAIKSCKCQNCEKFQS